MGKLITVVGNSGVGKTTIVKTLAEIGSFYPILEINAERPFQRKFKDNLKEFCLANQVDYLLYHAEKQLFVMGNDNVGIQDGGLDFTFNIFTKRFHQKGFLDSDQYHVCERLYTYLHHFLPLPDLRIFLKAPTDVIAGRMRKRGREIDIEESQDLHALEGLLADWLEKDTTLPTIHVDASQDDPSYASIINDLVKEIEVKLRM
jgi:deoxyadenosine/deoxycytidine kinase